MLVLTRKESEKILFPSLGISVEVLRVRGNKTQLGIDAPIDVPILRHEIADLKAIEFARANKPTTIVSAIWCTPFAHDWTRLRSI